MAFDYRQAHNMLALMLDPCYKSLRVVEKHVGCGNAIHLASKYDLKGVIPLLMTNFDGFFVEEEETNMFGVGASIEKSSRVLVIGELSLF
jgi:hypothetical protein